MQLAVRVVSGGIWLRNEYQKGLQTKSFHQKENVLSQLTYRPGITGLVGLMN